MNRLSKEDRRLTLQHAYENQRVETIPVSQQVAVSGHWFNAFVLFNLEAAFDEGHAILALGPIGGPLETYSFYREGNAIEAPARMACLREPISFVDLQEADGWIIHGNPGNYWNEHVNAALALAFPQSTYDPIRAFAEAARANPGTYNLIAHNCLHFVEEALTAGNVRIETHSGRELRTIVPKDAFKDARTVSGDHAERFAAWKYWFPRAAAPENGLRVIPD